MEKKEIILDQVTTSDEINLIQFIEGITVDSRLKPVHISLSIALCQAWITNGFQCSYHISRRLLMKYSHIRSRATYHKILKELQSYGYIRYAPSYHPVKASKITLISKANKLDNTTLKQ